MQQVITLIAIAAVMFIVIGGISLIAHYYTLNGIKSKTVGDGQHGTAQWAGKKEIVQTYLLFPLMFPIGGRGRTCPNNSKL